MTLLAARFLMALPRPLWFALPFKVRAWAVDRWIASGRSVVGPVLPTLSRDLGEQDMFLRALPTVESLALAVTGRD